MKKKWLAGLLSTVAVVTLAACASGGSSTTTSSSSSSADTETFTYAINGDPSSTNPINTSNRWGLTLTNFIYSPLIRVEADGTYVNELADSYEVAEDGLSITVKLRQDVNGLMVKILQLMMLSLLMNKRLKKKMVDQMVYISMVNL